MFLLCTCFFLFFWFYFVFLKDAKRTHGCHSKRPPLIAFISKKGANALFIGILTPCHPFLKKS